MENLCVANHTSPIDVIILASDGCYAMVSVMFVLMLILTCGRCINSVSLWGSGGSGVHGGPDWGSFRGRMLKPVLTSGSRGLK